MWCPRPYWWLSAVVMTIPPVSLGAPSHSDGGLEGRVAGSAIRYRWADRGLLERTAQAFRRGKGRVEEALGQRLEPLRVWIAEPPLLSHPRQYYASAKAVWLAPKAVSAASRRLLEDVVTHELVHACLYQAAGEQWCRKQPYWFIEGLATYVGSPRLDLELLRRAVRDGRVPSLEMLSKPWWQHGRSFEALGYQYAYTLFDLIVRERGEVALREIAAHLRRHRTAEEIIRAVTGMTLGQLETRWRQEVAALADVDGRRVQSPGARVGDEVPARPPGEPTHARR